MVGMMSDGLCVVSLLFFLRIVVCSRLVAGVPLIYTRKFQEVLRCFFGVVFFFCAAVDCFCSYGAGTHWLSVSDYCGVFSPHRLYILALILGPMPSVSLLQNVLFFKLW